MTLRTTGLSEHAMKRERVLAILKRRGADAVLLTSATSLGWYLDAARTHVSLAADPVLAVRVDAAGDQVFLTSNEAGRLTSEELPDGVSISARAWYEPVPEEARVGALTEADLERELWEARWALLPDETARFRHLGRDAAEVVTAVLSAAEPSWTERQVAAEVSRGLVERGADPLVILVGGASRSAWPHPLPTAAAIGTRALVVVCARRSGLIANLSRLVAFSPPNPAEQHRQAAIFAVEQAAFEATRPGARLSEVLATIAAAYASVGFSADHWRGHHQGGLAGYAGRDPRASPATDHPVAIGQAFAWNPWAAGAKVEDTVLLTDSGLDILTLDPAWPTVAIAGRPRPDVMVR